MSYSNYDHTYRRNRIVEPSQLLAAEDIFHPHATQKYMLGAILDLNDGRRFRYCEEDGTGLAFGYMTQAVAGTANWQLQAQTNGRIWSVGDESIVVTLAATVAAHDLRNGYLLTEDGTGEGQLYMIKDNDVGTSNATSGYDVRLYLADAGGIRVLTATSLEVTVVKNKYKDVCLFKTNQTGVATGVALATVTANYFFWAQTRGPCPMVQDDTDQPVVGDYACQSDSAAGTAAVPAAIADDIIFGTVLHAAATAGDYCIVDLAIE